MANQSETKTEVDPAADVVVVDEEHPEKGEVIPVFTEKQTKALLRKIDLHLIPFLSLLYLLSFLE
jgi:hypothetical protein